MNNPVYLCLLSTCFGQPIALHQEKIALSMRQWYLSFCVGGLWSVEQTPRTQSDKYHCCIDTAIFS